MANPGPRMMNHCAPWRLSSRHRSDGPRVGFFGLAPLRLARITGVERPVSPATGRDDGLLDPVVGWTDCGHENRVGQTPGRAPGSDPDPNAVP